jgi:hypothetical protein
LNRQFVLRKFRQRVMIVLPFFLVFSCDILRESPFEVSSWSPGEGYYDKLSTVPVSLTFSHSPDRLSIERYFSMTEDGNRIKGSFSWDGKKMIFLPSAPLEENRNYAIVITADAHDDAGLSLDKSFEGRFSTRSDSGRPKLLSIVPETESIMTDIRGEIRMLFSQALPVKSCNEYISFGPAINGAWQIEGDGTAAVFTPLENWKQGQRYEVRVSASLAGINGLTMGKEFLSVFTAGDDITKPFLEGAYRLSDDVLLTGLAESNFGLLTENTGWEKHDKICLRFSEPVDTSSVTSYLSAEGASSLFMETTPGFAEEVIFSLEEVPVWGSRFFFWVKAGIRDAGNNESETEHIFRILADGKYSKPPALVGIRLPLAPGKILEEEKELTSYSIDDLFADFPVTSGPDHFPYSTKIAEWIELYFDTAEGASIDLFSVMDLFHIDTSNDALSFSSRSVTESDFSILSPFGEWASYQRVEIRGFLTNTINSGVVNFRLGAGLKDSLGNRNEKLFCISLLK